ncbi:MAG: hypothetical protein JG764_2146 [Clostridiales bacterium]|nr:hypothetical protein [Clostridiales bacterium]
MTLKVLIVEDDPGMRLILKKALENLPDVNIVGEASNGKEALDQTMSLEPEVVFMDIDLPDKNGVEVSKEILDIDSEIFLIYATGYSEYMPEAFEMYAFDYMMKPYRIDRISETIERIHQLVETRERAFSRQEKLSSSVNISKKVAVKVDHNVVFIEMEKIVFVNRAKRKTIIYLENGKTISTNEPLDVIEKRLNENSFFRSHRSYIINLDKVAEIQPWARGSYIVIFNNNNNKANKKVKKVAHITENKYKELQEKFKII